MRGEERREDERREDERREEKRRGGERREEKRREEKKKHLDGIRIPEASVSNPAKGHTDRGPSLFYSVLPTDFQLISQIRALRPLIIIPSLYLRAEPLTTMRSG